jgi:hypothetical protein
MDQLIVNVLDYNEFDELVHKHFPERADYAFVADEEASNGSAYLCEDVGVPLKYKEGTPAEQIESWRQGEIQDFQEWLQKEKFSGVGKFQILEALCRKGVIEPGNYLIKVSW